MLWFDGVSANGGILCFKIQKRHFHDLTSFGSNIIGHKYPEFLQCSRRRPPERLLVRFNLFPGFLHYRLQVLREYKRSINQRYQCRNIFCFFPLAKVTCTDAPSFLLSTALTTIISFPAFIGTA